MEGYQQYPNNNNQIRVSNPSTLLQLHPTIKEEHNIGQGIEIPTTLFNLDMLSNMVKKLANDMDISQVDNNVILYLSLATQTRLKELLLHSIDISQHRVSSQIVDAPPLDEHDQPVYKVTDVLDIKKQLLAIERVEREEERKRREIIAERERQANQSDGGGDYSGDPSMNEAGSMSGGFGGGDDGTKKKKKKKKDQALLSSSGRDITEDLRKKTTNETNYTALMLAGGVRKSWMLSGSNNAGAASAIPLSSSSLSLSPSSSSTNIDKDTIPASPLPLQNNNNGNSEDLPSSQLPSSTQSPSSSQTRGSTGSGRGRPKGGKKASLLEHGGIKRTKSSFRRDRSQDSFLPPSMLSRHQHKLNEQSSRKVTVFDTIHALENEVEAGCGSGNLTLIKSYNRYLK
ncbi:unnamed protein product [Cunninghamella blakesleeana]